jgi:CopG family nickel-responsive transcriptional regulator
LTVISISLTPELLAKLDDFVDESGYSSRSEAIRVAVREVLSQHTLRRLERGRVVATITVISDRERQDPNSRLMELRHEFDESIYGNMHLHIGRGYCVEIFIMREESEIVFDFVSRVRAIRGIREVKYALTPIEE